MIELVVLLTALAAFGTAVIYLGMVYITTRCYDVRYEDMRQWQG